MSAAEEAAADEAAAVALERMIRRECRLQGVAMLPEERRLLAVMLATQRVDFGEVAITAAVAGFLVGRR